MPSQGRKFSCYCICFRSNNQYAKGNPRCEKSTKCIIADMEDMETSIYKKIDQSMAWMKEHFTKVIKSTYFNPDVPVTGEFCIFGFCFNLNLVINFASSPESG